MPNEQPEILITEDWAGDFTVEVSPSPDDGAIEREFDSAADAVAFAQLLNDCRGWPIKSLVGQPGSTEEISR